MQRPYKSIEVFQELRVHSADRAAPEEFRSAFRQAVLNSVPDPWYHDDEAEDRVDVLGQDDAVLVLGREASESLPAATLILWTDAAGFRVTNIVPQSSGSLSIATYNKLLKDFERYVLEKASMELTFEVTVSRATQSLTDWMDEESAWRLAAFSNLANKSTGASHPQDRDRWNAFLIAIHRGGRNRLDADLLERWLHEAEGWSEEGAFDLSAEYERARELLTRYDEHADGA